MSVKWRKERIGRAAAALGPGWRNGISRIRHHRIAGGAKACTTQDLGHHQFTPGHQPDVRARKISP